MSHRCRVTVDTSQPLDVAGLRALREGYTRTIAPARALAAEALTLERSFKAEGGM